jgi:alkanesulfonate monooxygenase SsuD/methylene tetrahydromethanopterin reductase-like flavin-dependent oxidoreductase (luciferase family)
MRSISGAATHPTYTETAERGVAAQPDHAGHAEEIKVGSPDDVVEKILRHNEVLGGVVRLSFMMNVASLPQVRMMHAIDAIGARVAPALRDAGRQTDG